MNPKRTAFHNVGKGSVDVVSAREQMFPNGNSFGVENALALCDGNEREVCRSSANITNEDEIPMAQLSSPCGSIQAEPSVKSSEGFFDEDDFLQTRPLGGLDGQFAGNGIKRRRYG